MTGQEIIQRVLSSATMTIDELARESGISPAALYSWQAGRRNPSPENLAKLRAALLARGADLRALADELGGLLPALWQADVDSDGYLVGDTRLHTGHAAPDTCITLSTSYGSGAKASFRFIASSQEGAREGARRCWQRAQD